MEELAIKKKKEIKEENLQMRKKKLIKIIFNYKTIFLTKIFYS